MRVPYSHAAPARPPVGPHTDAPSNALPSPVGAATVLWNTVSERNVLPKPHPAFHPPHHSAPNSTAPIPSPLSTGHAAYHVPVVNTSTASPDRLSQSPEGQGTTQGPMRLVAPLDFAHSEGYSGAIAGSISSPISFRAPHPVPLHPPALALAIAPMLLNTRTNGNTSSPFLKGNDNIAAERMFLHRMQGLLPPPPHLPPPQLPLPPPPPAAAATTATPTPATTLASTVGAATTTTVIPAEAAIIPATTRATGAATEAGAVASVKDRTTGDREGMEDTYRRTTPFCVPKEGTALVAATAAVTAAMKSKSAPSSERDGLSNGARSDSSCSSSREGDNLSGSRQLDDSRERHREADRTRLKERRRRSSSSSSRERRRRVGRGRSRSSSVTRKSRWQRREDSFSRRSRETSRSRSRSRNKEREVRRGKSEREDRVQSRGLRRRSRSKSRSRSRSPNRKRRDISSKPSTQPSKVPRTVDPRDSRDLRVGSRDENDRMGGKVEARCRVELCESTAKPSVTGCEVQATGGISHLTTPTPSVAETTAVSTSLEGETDCGRKDEGEDDSPVNDGATDDYYVIDRGSRCVNALLESTGVYPTPPTGPLDSTTRESSPLDVFLENEETEYTSD